MIRALLALIVLAGVAAAQDYDLPAPLIEVFKPSGLRVSIPDSPGISNFKFKALLNGGPSYYERNIELETHRAVNGRWTVEDELLSLGKGNNIKYVFDIRRDGLGYQTGHGEFAVPDSLPYRDYPPGYDRLDPNGRYNDTYGPEFISYPTPDLGGPATTIANMSQTIVNLQAQIESLTANNTRLSRLIESCTGPNKILLSGMVPPSDDSKETVKFILREILFLQSNVTVAEKKTDGTIEFEVSTLAEKVAILDAAEAKLTNSTIKFTSSK